MKRLSILFLRLALLALGTIALAVCIFALPPTWQAVAKEYPNHTYVFYTIILGLYAAAIVFFAALYQTYRLLNYIDDGKAFSKLSVKALKRIAYCGVAIGTVFTALLPFFYIWAQNDDAPGLILIDAMLVGASLTVSVFAAVLQRLLSDAIDLKSENDLTV